MRIISGRWKGRRIETKLPSGIRPTQDAIKETIFNILNNYIGFEDIECADICAGAGMLGIEALSRGAKKVYFVDKNKNAIEYIQNTLSLLKTNSNMYKTLKLDATQFLNHYNNLIVPKSYLNLIFTDPPYKTSIINDILQLTIENSILANKRIIVAETSIFTQLIINDFYEILTERQFGISKIIILRKL